MDDLIIEVLELFIRKLKRGECTREQVKSAYTAITENMDIFASADELAEMYGKSRDAVHSVIKRRMIQKPRRNITLYSFKAFRKLVPPSWRRKD